MKERDGGDVKEKGKQAHSRARQFSKKRKRRCFNTTITETLWVILFVERRISVGRPFKMRRAVSAIKRAARELLTLE